MMTKTSTILASIAHQQDRVSEAAKKPNLMSSNDIHRLNGNSNTDNWHNAADVARRAVVESFSLLPHRLIRKHRATGKGKHTVEGVIDPFDDLLCFTRDLDQDNEERT